MFNRVFGLVIILAVPLFALGVGHRIESVYETRWREASNNQSDTVGDLTLAHVCAEHPAAGALVVCGWYKGVRYMELGSRLALLLGILLLAAIYMLGRHAKADRRRLCNVFVPGLYGIFVSLIILTVLHGALLAAVLLYGGIATFGRPSVYGTFTVIGVVMTTIFAVVILVWGMLQTISKAKTGVVGKRLTPESSPKLWNFVNSLSGTLGSLSPDNLIVGLEPTFFVTEADVKKPGGTFAGRTMYLSLPLCRILNESELRAVLGHELGHFRGADTKFSQKFYPIYRGVKNSIYSLAGNQRGGAQGLVFFPALAILSLYLEAFETVEAGNSRERELIADQAGAEASNTEAIASALVKLHAFDHYYESARQRMREALTSGNETTSLGILFADCVKTNATPNHFIGLDEDKLAHPTDSHPPLSVRLEALGLALADVGPAALEVAPQNCAVLVIDDYATIEKELTNLEKDFMIKTGEVSVVAEFRCPGCGRRVARQVDSCECGFNFRRVGLR